MIIEEDSNSSGFEEIIEEDKKRKHERWKFDMDNNIKQIEENRKKDMENKIEKKERRRKDSQGAFQEKMNIPKEKKELEKIKRKKKEK
jgi:hypothetical protein